MQQLIIGKTCWKSMVLSVTAVMVMDEGGGGAGAASGEQVLETSISHWGHQGQWQLCKASTVRGRDVKLKLTLA